MNDTLAGASPVDQPVRLDPERLAFEDWADERWGREAYRHKSDTCGARKLRNKRPTAAGGRR